MHLNQWKSLLTTHQNPLAIAPSPTQQQPENTQNAQNAMDQAHQQLLQRIHQQTESTSMQSDAIIEKLDILRNLAIDGQIKGLGLFWSMGNGYNCFITNTSGDIFGLFGYISAATDRYVQEYLDEKEFGDDEEDTEDDEDSLC